MQAARRDWMRIAVVSMGIAGLVGLGVLASELFVARAQRDAAQEAVGSSSDKLREALRAGAARRDGTDARGEESTLDVTRSFESSALLAPPDAEFRSRVEQQGRALFWGLVLAPDGRPCADATVFHGGNEVARSDRDGAWRIEVPHDVAIAFGRQAASKDEPALLAARKEGIGFACVDLLGPSRRIDLTLARGKRLKGECLERGSRRPVPRARLTFLFVPSLDHEPVIACTLDAQADDVGRFAISDVPAGAFDVRGETDGQDTRTFEPFNFPGDRDRDYYVFFDPKLTIRGWFEPWPPWSPAQRVSPSLLSSPRVVATPHRSHDRGLDEREFAGEVGADGRFSLTLPSCERFDARLVAGGGEFWWTTCELEFGPHDFDFGKIELPAPALVEGRLDLPEEVVDLGVIVSVTPRNGANRGGIQVVPRRDGRFGPVPVQPGWINVSIELPSSWIRFYMADRNDGIGEIEPGAQLDLGTIGLGPQGRFVYGRVTDDENVPVAWARISRDDSSGEYWMSSDCADVDGAFALNIHDRWRTDADGNLVLSELDGPRRIQVSARGFASKVVELDLPAASGIRRLDLRLSRALPFHAKLVDEDGRALSGWHAKFWNPEVVESAAVATSRRRYVPRESLSDAWQITDDQGELTIYGLPETRMQAVASGGDRFEVDLGVVDASKRDVVLTVPKER